MVCFEMILIQMLKQAELLAGLSLLEIAFAMILFDLAHTYAIYKEMSNNVYFSSIKWMEKLMPVRKVSFFIIKLCSNMLWLGVLFSLKAQ